MVANAEQPAGWWTVLRGRLATHVGRLAAALRRRAAVVSASTDRWDVLCVLGLVFLNAGLWIWFGLGPALSVVGALLLALGVLGGLNAGPVPPDEQTGG